MSLHKEISFENEICDALAEQGWLYAETVAKYQKNRLRVVRQVHYSLHN